MASRNVDDFLTHYRILCSDSKVWPLKSIQKYIQRTELSCPVEDIRKEHWPYLLETLQTDNSLSKVAFSCNLSHASQQQKSKIKQKIMDKYFPVPYGCTAENISSLCCAVGSLICISKRLQDVRLENLCLSKEDVVILADSLHRSKITILSLADSQFDDESFEILCQKLYNSKVSYLNLTSCHIIGERLKSLCRLMKFNKSRRSKDMYFMSLRNCTPLVEEKDGLSRVTLNDNVFGDEGVEMIMEHLEDDMWIKVLDFQKCGIGNVGARCIFEALKSNITFQEIDLRLNTIDKNYLANITLQLSLNNSGKELLLDIGPVWTPRKHTIRTPRRHLLRTKAKKTNSVCEYFTVLKTRPKPKPCPHYYENAYAFSHDTLKFRPFGSQVDKSVQTDVQTAEQGRIKAEKALTNEIRLRECLMHLLKKYKMENCILRKEVQKLSKLDDHILIDQETFSEVKNTFEKFKRFLNVMKEYGLFECIAMLGVNENTDIVLKPMIVNATKKCMQLIENEPSPTSSASEPVDPAPPNESEKTERTQEPRCFNPRYDADVTAALYKNGFAKNAEKLPVYNFMRKLPSADKALVQRVYKEVRESYSNSSQAGHPSFPPKLIARRPEMPVRKRPKSSSKNSLMKDMSKIEATHKLRHLRNPKEYYSAVANDIGQCDLCEVSASCGKPFDGYDVVHKKTVSSQTPGIQKTVLTIRMEDFKNAGKAPCGSRKPETPVGATGPRVTCKLPPSARPKLKGSTKRGSLAPTAVVPSVPKHAGFQNPALSSGSAGNIIPKTSRSESVVGGRVHSNTRIYVNMNKPEVVVPSSSSSSVNSYNSQEGAEPGLQYSSDGKNDSSKSYLESVSDASTDKDVKSLAESEVYSMAGSQKGSKVPSEAENKAGSTDSSRSSKLSKKKRSKNGSKSSLTQGSVQKNASDLSVPSLSDITTVSSRSLNTNSVLGQLSNADS